MTDRYRSSSMIPDERVSENAHKRSSMILVTIVPAAAML